MKLRTLVYVLLIGTLLVACTPGVTPTESVEATEITQTESPISTSSPEPTVTPPACHIDLISPIDGAVVNGGEKLKFQWDSDSEIIGSYKLQLTENGVDASYAEDGFEKELYMSTFRPYDEVTYEWTVTLLGENTQSICESETYTFTKQALYEATPLSTLSPVDDEVGYLFLLYDVYFVPGEKYEIQWAADWANACHGSWQGEGEALPNEGGVELIADQDVEIINFTITCYRNSKKISQEGTIVPEPPSP